LIQTGKLLPGLASWKSAKRRRRERETGDEGQAPEFAPAFLTGGNDED
jgi:hypothetical protein